MIIEHTHLLAFLPRLLLLISSPRLVLIVRVESFVRSILPDRLAVFGTIRL